MECRDTYHNDSKKKKYKSGYIQHSDQPTNCYLSTVGGEVCNIICGSRHKEHFNSRNYAHQLTQHTKKS